MTSEERRRKAWADSLPTMEISEEEAQSIAEARAEIVAGDGKILSLKEIIAEALED